ncbi:MAG: site-specific DNA-methyltransferase [Elusimicrobiota bacterium]|jgi:site-specific DNA-methyltransferase (adenine-specific)|nr:site-specific DNA-methyltransferase [Elusimicrobiota bacterium]
MKNIETNKQTQQIFLIGDCKEKLKTISDNYIDFILTSPPYDNLRDYEGFEFSFQEISRQLYRLLKNGGVMVWIVGDAVVKGGETLTSFKQALYFQQIGFRVHDTMIYQKNNFSNPSKNRYHQIFEYMFVLSKGTPKTFNPIFDRKNVYAGFSSFGENTTRKKDGKFTIQRKRIIQDYGMRYNIWKGNTSGQENMCRHIEHPATFPMWLAKDHIRSWTNEGDIVLDPFMGSGTTGAACKELGRNFIGCDIESKYVVFAQERIAKHKCGAANGLF